jgi:hypothetical protein
MEAAASGGNPDLLRGVVSIDDDLAAVGELDFEDAVADHLKVEIGAATFQPGFDLPGTRIGERVEFLVIHPVLPSPAFVDTDLCGNILRWLCWQPSRLAPAAPKASDLAAGPGAPTPAATGGNRCRQSTATAPDAPDCEGF